MTTTTPNLCLSCEHLDRDTLGYEDTPKCTAYPRAIPVEIFNQGADHRLPRDDQANDITYKMIPGLEMSFEIWREMVAP